MLKVGLVGFGFMGRMNFDNYVQLNEDGYPISLVAICDSQIAALQNAKSGGNMNTARELYDLSAYNLKMEKWSMHRRIGHWKVPG